MAYGVNIDQRKTNKRNYIIDLFRRNEVLSKAEAKKLSGYSMDTILSIFSTLQEEGLIEESTGTQKPKGRKATFFRLVPSKALYLGITYNQSGIFSSVVSFSFEVISTHVTKLDMGTTREEFIAIFREHIARVFAEDDTYQRRIKGIGCAVPGGIDPETGLRWRYTFMPFMDEVNFKDIIAPLYPEKSVMVRHNVESMASYFLHDADLVARYRRILFISARAGTASGLIHNGTVVVGNGEFGHIHVSDDGKKCLCGRTGCLDCYFSMKSFNDLLVERGRITTGDRISGMAEQSLMAELYRSGDGDIAVEMDRRLGLFCGALLDAVNISGPDLIILSGELLKIYGDPLEKIRSIMDAAFPDSGFVGHFRRAETVFLDMGPELSAQGICYKMIQNEWDYVREV